MLDLLADHHLRHRATLSVSLALLASALLLPQAALAQIATPSADAGILPAASLSPWQMIARADAVVQTVFVLLALASVFTWTVWLVKTVELAVCRRRLLRGLQTLAAAPSLFAAAADLGEERGVTRALTEAASTEWRRSVGLLGDGDGLKERITLHLVRIEAAAGRRMTVGTGILATVGAVGPFVGLFGTVWGIMNSFIGIAKLHTTNLAVVAPGIAEALLATAIGLVAAIPAVVLYNHFSRRIGAYKALTADAASAVLQLVSRDLSRAAVEVTAVGVREIHPPLHAAAE